MPTLEHLQAEYAKLIGKLPNNKKNDVEWISNKLAEYESGKEVDSTPDEDGNATPEEGMITKPTEAIEEAEVEPIKEEVKEEKEEKVEKETSINSLAKIQAFYGISNEELYNDDILVKKYSLNKKEMSIIRSHTAKEDKDVHLNLNYHDMPDYIQVIYMKYGFNPEILKSEELIRKTIMGNNKASTPDEELMIHQMIEFYNLLRSEATKHDEIAVNPNLVKPL